jgi:hypothetical protein
VKEEVKLGDEDEDEDEDGEIITYSNRYEGKSG